MIKTVNTSDYRKYEKEVNELIKEGYHVSSTSCGYVGEVGAMYMIVNTGWQF